MGTIFQKILHVETAPSAQIAQVRPPVQVRSQGRLRQIQEAPCHCRGFH